ncbi:hypothetical protein [Pseudomonas sp. BN414]|nr:hypothetical protein [Pseudomonas sp. BN414]
MPRFDHMPHTVECPLKRWSRPWLSKVIQQGVRIFLATMAHTAQR